MAEYFLKIHSFTRETPQNVFVGPFKDKVEVGHEFERVKDLPGVEVITNGTEPQDAEKAIHVEIIGKTEARKAGMRHPDMGDSETPTLIAASTPDNILDLAIEANPPEGEPTTAEPKKRGRKPGQTTGTGKAAVAARTSTPLRGTQPELTPTVSLKKAQASESIEGKTFEDVVQEYKDTFGVEPNEILIVSKFPGTINWLRAHGINGRIVDRIRRPEQVKNLIVIGTVPFRLAALAFKVGTIDLPGLRVDQLGKPLSANELDEAGASIRWYTVKEG